MEGMGKHQSLIDEGTFKIVQNILSGKSDYSIRHRKHNFLLRGLAFCRCCGRRYVAEWHKNEKKLARLGGKIAYYHCSQVGKRGKCPSSYVELNELENQVAEAVSKLKFKQEFIDAVKRNIRLVYEESIGRIASVKKALNNRKVAVEEKQERLEEELLAGTIGREAFKRLNTKIDSELLDIQDELLKVNKLKTVDINIIEEVLTITQDIVQAYRDADTDRKRAYLHFFFTKLWIKDKKIADIEYQPVIQELSQTNSVILSATWLPVPRIIITLDFASIIRAFQDLRYIGELRQRWEEIKKLKLTSRLEIA